MHFTLIVTAIGLGIAYAAAPGAVNTGAIRRGAVHGAHSTLLVETGSLIGDSLRALLALTGITVFARHLAIQIVLGIAGGCFLLRLAWLALYEPLLLAALRQSTYPLHEEISPQVWSLGWRIPSGWPSGLAWAGVWSLLESLDSSGHVSLDQCSPRHRAWLL